MPTVFVHGVTVRPVSFHLFEEKVRLALRHRRSEAEMGFAAYFWGGDAAALRWGGASIPGLTEEDQIVQKADLEAQVSVPTLRTLLLMYPLAELQSYRENAPAAGFRPDYQRNQDRNAQLRAAEPALIATLALRLTAAALPDVAESALLQQSVRAVLEAATETESRLLIPDLIPLIANALTASLCRRTAPAFAALDTAETWEALHTPIEAAVNEVLGGQLGTGKSLRNAALSLATFALRHGLRRRIMPPVVRFIGDGFVYLTDRERYLEGLHATVVAARLEAQAKGGQEPLWLVGHSLGGILAFDFCCRYPQVTVDRLATVGSQVGLMAEADLLWQPHEEAWQQGRRPVPGNVRYWINIYDQNDMLSFRAAPVFDRVDEQERGTGAPFPDAHGAYWDNGAVYDSIFA
jgi:pimeloyl-ACP methyl ester carboxylesterase